MEYKMTGEERSINGTYNRGMKFGFSLGKQQTLKDVLKIIDDIIDDIFDEGCEDYIEKEDLVCGTFVGKKLILCIRCKYYKRNLKAQIEKELGVGK
jgi:hypothetical protein